MAPYSRFSSSLRSRSRSCSPKRRCREGRPISDVKYHHIPRPPAAPPSPPPVRHPYAHSRHRHLCSRYLENFHISPSHDRNKKANAGSARYHHQELRPPLPHGHCLQRGCFRMKPPKPLHKAHRRLIKRLRQDHPPDGIFHDILQGSLSDDGVQPREHWEGCCHLCVFVARMQDAGRRRTCLPSALRNGDDAHLHLHPYIGLQKATDDHRDGVAS
ncbi:hypothetical protein KP509_36G028100 [Ceratopteris richardii]|uniref:Uncharacterized protein n=1 Tax=Ceratopteris richardii TaxID=49495 RepID=A0A8T2QB72_CERRI|nr:hypothetical protein KP509_36G028100 [Ceratopteris richardii]